jgi:hypothetical protein
VFSFQADLKKEKGPVAECERTISELNNQNKERLLWKQNVIRMNQPNLKALGSKAANKAAADSRAVVANRRIGISRNVNANSASARSRVAAAKGAVAAKNVAAANKQVSKAADDKPCALD